MKGQDAKKIMATAMPRYNGFLSRKQVEEGKNLARENAKRLLESARVLMHIGDAPTGLSLSILALEEYGKIEILDRIGLAKTKEEVASGWLCYRNHISKTGAFNKLYAALKNVPEGEEMKSFCERNEDILPLLDLLKQMGFYTDCGWDGRWHNPCEMNTLLAGALVSAVEEIINGVITPGCIVQKRILSDLEKVK